MSQIICIDARFWGTRNTGIGRYIQNLISNLPKNDKYQIILIVPPDLLNHPDLSDYRKISAKSHPYSIIAGQFEMASILWKLRPHLLHVPHFTIPFLWPGKIVITIHDLIKHISKGPQVTTHSPLFYWLKYYLYLFVMWFAVHRSSHIFVPANYWKKELITRYGLSEKKLSVTYEGVEEKFSRPSSIKLDIPDHKPYVLFVGNVYPHKNIPTLLNAIEQLDGEVLLLIVCARSVFTSRVEKLISEKGLQKWVKFLGSVSDEALAYLYQNALAFVFPSLIEGFGLPGLEAMASGTPVIAANSSCLPEIYQDAAIFFSPMDSKELAQDIINLKQNPRQRSSLIMKGKQLIKKYSWADMAQSTWEIYRKMLL